MLKKSFAILIFALGLIAGFSARANDCPTDNGLGVGCNIGIGEYYCGGACRTGQSQCLTWTPSPVCASGFSCANFATADACGYGATCSSGYTRCGTWPNYTCTSTIAPVSPCSTYDTCNNYCTACIANYTLCSSTHVCVANLTCQPGQTFNPCTNACEGTVSMLKLGYDSVSGTSVIQSATYPTLFIPSSSNVGIGTSTPSAKLEIIPTSGYSILAGNFKIGNVAMPTTDADAATKGYVDSVISSATSSITTLWDGTTGGNIWNLNSGNVGIGTMNPGAYLQIGSSTNQFSSYFNATHNGLLIIPNIAYARFAVQGNSGASFYLGNTSAGVDTKLVEFGDEGGYTFIRSLLDAGGVKQNLIWMNNSTGNVGIGTTAPASALHVNGGNAAIIVDTTSGVPGLQLYSSGSRKWIIGSRTSDSNNLYFSASPAGTDGTSIATAAKMTITQTGNVGIGTTTPAARLEAVPASGYSILAGNFKIGNVALPTADADAATKGYVDSTIASATSSITGLPTGTSGQTLRHDGANWVANSVLYNNGTNIGIGTSTPNAKLDVVGAIRSTQNTSGYSEFTHANAADSASFPRAYFKIYGGGSENNSALYVAPGNALGTTMQPVFLGLSTNSNVKQSGSKQALLYLANNAFSLVTTDAENSGGTKIPWYLGGTYTNGSDADLTLAANGNVGIGTTTPLARLEVVPASGYSILAGSYKIGNVALPTADADAATKGYVDSTIASATSSITLWGGTTGGNIWNLNSGNVGIGTAAPGYRFHLKDITSSNSLVTIGRLEGNNGVIDIQDDDRTAYKRMTLRIDNKVDVINYPVFLTGTLGNSYAYFGFNGKGTMLWGSGSSNYDTNLYRNAANQLRTNDDLIIDGNVGIGTTTPAYPLHIYSSGNIHPTIESSAESSYLTLQIKNSIQAWQIGFHGDSSKFRIRNTTSSTYPFVIDTSGNIGIGTTTPLARLEVVPSSGYSILAGSYKIGNVALPTTDADAATKGYVDSTVASATSSITLWGGTTGGNIWNLNSGNVGIGTTNPQSLFHLLKVSDIDSEILRLEVKPNTNSQKGSPMVIFYGGYGDSNTVSYKQGKIYSKGDASGYQNGRLTLASIDSGGNWVDTLTTKNGNVGIGTTNPGARLSLDSTGLATYSTLFNLSITNSAINGMNFTDTSTDNRGMITSTSNIGSTGNKALFFWQVGNYNGNSGDQGWITQTVMEKNSGGSYVAPTQWKGWKYIYYDGSAYQTPFVLTNTGNVGIGTTTPTARLEVVPASGYSILAGSYKIGNVALPTADADAATKGYVDSTIASATSSISSIAVFVGVTSSTFSGNNSSNNGYAYAHAQCASAYAGSHVCAAFEILNTIKSGGSVPSQDAWIFNGPPAYTALANDCDARTSATSAAYGAYWQKPATGYPEGRGLLIQCNNVLRLACCK